MTGLTDYLKAYYRVCRLEYLPGEIPAVFTVLFLGSATISRFFEIPVIEALIAFVLLYLSGFIINAITDKEIDQKYDTFKTSIPKSVDVFGEKTVKAMVIGHVIIATILGIHISFQMSTFIPIGLVLLGVFFGIGYSVRPLNFKVRGIWHAIALGSSAFFLPFIFLMFVITDGLITLPLIIFILGFSFVHYGMEFGNQAIDYVEDRDSNVKTPPVRWGMIPSLKIALGCVVTGFIAEALSLYYILISKGSFTFIHPVLTTNVVYSVLLAIIIAGYIIPTKGLWKMLHTLKESDTIEEGMPTLKKICNYAKWQTSGILGVAIVSAILFLGVVYSPVAKISPGNEEGNITEGIFKISIPPDVEFYKDSGECWANVSISVLNDETPKERGSMMIWLESWTANHRFKIQSVLLEQDLMPNDYWNITTKIRAHDIDDTTIKIYLYVLSGQTGLSQIQIGEPWIIPSQKDIYIYDVEPEYYDDFLHNKKARLTVDVFNEDNSRNIGDLEVKVRCYTSYWILWDEQDVKNNLTVHANEHWTPTMTLDINDVDLSDPIFEIIVYYENGQIDNMFINN